MEIPSTLCSNVYDFAFCPEPCYDRLADLADPEDWGPGNRILKNYLSFSFSRAVFLTERDVDQTAPSNLPLVFDDDRCLFNTGLYTRRYETIYGLFEPNTKPDARQRWFLKGFFKESDPMLVSFEYLPCRVRFAEDPSELVFDYRLPIRSNIDHILGDEENLTRIPASLMGEGNSLLLRRAFEGAVVEAARRAASTAFFAALGLSALLLAAGLLFAAPVLRLLGAPESAVTAGLPYARAVFVSGPPLCGALVLSSLLRAQGKTLPNMAAALAGSALGAALLLLLCGRMGLGASGAGMAMLAREAATLAVLLAYTLRHGELIRPSLRRVRLTRAVFSEIMRSGLPTLLRQGATSVSAALLSRVSAGFGAPVLAGMGLCARAIMPFTSAVIGFGQGFQPVCGAAFGAKQTARCQEAYRFCQRVAIAFSLAAGLAFFIFAPAPAARFAPDAQSAEAARRALRLQSVAFPAQSAVILMTMLTQAMGLTLRASLVATSRQALFFLPLLAVLPRLFGLWGLLACQSASDLAALGFSLALTRGLRGSSSARCGCSDARTACRSHPRSSS